MVHLMNQKYTILLTARFVDVRLLHRKGKENLMSAKQNKLYSVYWESPHDGDNILTVASSEIEAYEKVCKRLCDKGASPSFICPAVEVSEVDGYKIILEEKKYD